MLRKTGTEDFSLSILRNRKQRKDVISRPEKVFFASSCLCFRDKKEKKAIVSFWLFLGVSWKLDGKLLHFRAHAFVSEASFLQRCFILQTRMIPQGKKEKENNAALEKRKTRWENVKCQPRFADRSFWQEK